MVSFDESSDHFRELCDALDMGVVRVDASLRIREWNRFMETASGLSTLEVSGRSITEVFPEIAAGSGEAAFRRAITGESVVLAHRFHRYLLPLESAAVPEFSRMQQTARILPVLRNGRPAGAIAMIQDVTERVAREEQLRLAMERAEAASQAKSDFLATTSHELRTPLTAIIGYSDLLESEIAGPISPQQSEFLNRIKASTWHLLSLIDEILTFARIEAGRENIEWESLDLDEVVREAMVLLEPLALQKGLRLTHDATSVVPIVSDRRKLRQILLNLIGNAVKFTEQGSVRVEIAGGGEEVLCRVRDTGPGISEGDQARIFEAFTQANQKSTRSKGGTGLGLSVSRKLAELLGGSLTLESEPGVGSTFTLRLTQKQPELGPIPGVE